MRHSTPADPVRIAILTENVLEAADLQEIIVQCQLEPAMIFRKPEHVLDQVKREAFDATLVLFGWSTSHPEASECLDRIARSDATVILLDGPKTAAEPIGASVIDRPFTTDDIVKALKMADAV